jgi:hypothetical protein
VKVGDLVKFKNQSTELGPVGVIISLARLEKPPHPSQPDQDAVYVEWADPYTSTGNYQLFLLEVINENR